MGAGESASLIAKEAAFPSAFYSSIIIVWSQSITCLSLSSLNLCWKYYFNRVFCGENDSKNIKNMTVHKYGLEWRSNREGKEEKTEMKK